MISVKHVHSTITLNLIGHSTINLDILLHDVCVAAVDIHAMGVTTSPGY